MLSKIIALLDFDLIFLIMHIFMVMLYECPNFTVFQELMQAD